MRMYGIRGATTVEKNDKDEIIRETQVLMQNIIEKNNLSEQNVVSIIFTTTPDLNAEFPSKACRLLGWTNTAMLGAVEADVPHGLKLCIRVLVHANLEDKSTVKHIYLKRAVALRPDFAREN